jgi:hypothetical protein
MQTNLIELVPNCRRGDAGKIQSTMRILVGPFNQTRRLLLKASQTTTGLIYDQSLTAERGTLTIRSNVFNCMQAKWRWSPAALQPYGT